MDLSYFPLLSSQTLGALLATYALLFSCQVLVWIKAKGATEGKFGDLNERLRAWWYIFFSLTIVFLSRLWTVHIFWLLVSVGALREYFAIVPKRPEHTRVRLWLYLALPVQYAFILCDQYILFLMFIPVYVYLLFPVRMIAAGSTEGFLSAMGTMFWGIMMAGYSLSHVSYLSTLAVDAKFHAGPLGLTLFLLIATEMNDAFQYIWGKLFGKHAVVPTISPKKTWEGLAGGVLTTVAVSIVLAPILTPMSVPMAGLVGVLIACGGFFGDVTMSAVKRDLHVKDFGNLLPGHGGLLDRIDSLILTAPLFFHFIKYFYGPVML
jgi:phosphatidate cytidylyltransferase